MLISEIMSKIEEFSPMSLCEEWDNSGLIIGSPDTEVDTVLVSLDVTNEVISQAVSSGAQLIVSHHPVIFPSIKHIDEGSPVYAAIRSGIAILSLHTCFDSAECGVGYTLARVIGLTCFAPDNDYLYLYTGERQFETTLGLLEHVRNSLSASLRYWDSGKKIRKISVCGGSGGNLVRRAYESGADAYITGEGSHHDFLLAKELGLTFIVAGHYETEIIAVTALVNALTARLEGVNVITAQEKSPVSLY